MNTPPFQNDILTAYNLSVFTDFGLFRRLLHLFSTGDFYKGSKRLSTKGCRESGSYFGLSSSSDHTAIYCSYQFGKAD